MNSSEEHALEMLDPFVLLLLDCLKSMDVKVQFQAEICYSVYYTKKGPAHKCHLAVDLQEKRRPSSFQSLFHRCAD